MTKDQLRLNLSNQYGMGLVLEKAFRFEVAPGNWHCPTFSVMTIRPIHYSLGKVGGCADRNVEIFRRGNDRNMLGRWMDFNFLAEG